MGRLAQRVKASMGRYRLVWLVILAGLILLLLPTGEKEGEAREETEQTQSAFDLAATEARLSQALSKIHGAGEVTVVLTVANGPRQILAENVDRDGSQGEEKTETVVLSRGSGSLLLSGGTGLGKTFLSACIAREVSDAGFSVVYDTAISVFSRYEDAKFRPDEVSDADVRRCESCDLLILDDLGTEMTTAFVQSALYQIVNGRMLSGRSTIISTNLAPEELGHRYGAPILSRIEGAYQILPFFGEDIRTKQ